MKPIMHRLDKVFSQLVRAKAGKICQHCQEELATECSHFLSRRHRGSRWHLRNASAACHWCHLEIGKSRKYRESEHIRLHGDGVEAEMRGLPLLTGAELLELHKQYRADLKRIK